MLEPENRQEKKVNLLTFAIVFTVALAFVFLYALHVDIFSLTDAGMILGHLSGGLFISGLIFLCFGGLVFAKRQGTFDGISYGMRYTFNAIVPTFWLNKEERGGKFKKFGDYREAKREKEKKSLNLTIPFLSVGGLFALLGIVFTIIVNVYFPGTML